MRIPKYWIRTTIDAEDRNGTLTEYVAYGWSDESLSDAERLGKERARNIAERLRRDELPYRGGQRTADYDYLEAPPREEIIHTIGDNPLLPDIVITRNRYGALVLNASRTLFVDIDSPRRPKPKGFFDTLRYSFSKTYRDELEYQSSRLALTRIATWSQKNPSHGFRLYQTPAGFRLLFTSQDFEPLSPDVKRIFSELCSDALYQRLTERQQCFRARLTPKPWRIGLRRPATQFPRDKSGHAEFQSWLSNYEAKSKAYAACKYLDTLGPKSIDDARLQQTVILHDEYCQALTNRPLA